MKQWVLLLALSTCAFDLFGQSELSRSHSNVYVEAGGNGGFLSGNFERVFYLAEAFGTSSRVGLATTPSSDKSTFWGVNTPLTQSLLYGNGTQLEIGGGVTVIWSDGQKAESDPRTIYTGIFGGRYQNYETGLLFIVSFTPFFLEGEFAYWYGLSLGMMIDRKRQSSFRTN